MRANRTGLRQTSSRSRQYAEFDGALTDGPAPILFGTGLLLWDGERDSSGGPCWAGQECTLAGMSLLRRAGSAQREPLHQPVVEAVAQASCRFNLSMCASNSSSSARPVKK